MKFIYLFCLFSVISFLSPAQSAHEKAVSDAVEKLRKAMIEADKATLESLTSDSLSYGHSSGRVENKREFIESLVSGRSDFVTIDLTEQTIAVSHDVAIVRHVLSATTNDSGKPGTTKLTVLLIWQKEKGEWKLLARQAVKFT
jgi:ketosteroid isomerase-like protein